MIVFFLEIDGGKIMKIWTYNLGEWIKDGYELKDWSDETPEFEDFLKVNGFDNNNSFYWGREYYEHIIFYPLIHDETSWLADIPTTNSSFYFYIPDHPSFLNFKKEYKDLYNKKLNKFLEIGFEEFHNINLIAKITVHRNSSKEYLSFYDKDGSKIDSIEFSPKCNASEEWLKERSIID